MKIIIIGATSGIGNALAENYARAGHILGITGRRSLLLNEIQSQFPENIFTACFDVTGGNNISHLETLVSKLGGLDLLIYSSGTGEVSKALDIELDLKTTATNVNGFVEIAAWAFNYFTSRSGGQIAVISSIASKRGNSWAPAYSASKAFQSNYCEGLSIKARRMKKNISITCIEPGFVDTKMAKGNKLFWIVPVGKAAEQIIKAIEKKKRKVYISKRWWLIAKLLQLLPYSILKKII